mmetsp:Transcript_55312/g.160258  ORF Transcript_55312/g.160258 Transcript_55312/m.160258 type:complete len:295 (-) Transcript_55312:100-984(-)
MSKSNFMHTAAHATSNLSLTNAWIAGFNFDPPGAEATAACKAPAKLTEFESTMSTESGDSNSQPWDIEQVLTVPEASEHTPSSRPLHAGMSSRATFAEDTRGGLQLRKRLRCANVDRRGLLHPSFTSASLPLSGTGSPLSHDTLRLDETRLINASSRCSAAACTRKFDEGGAEEQRRSALWNMRRCETLAMSAPLPAMGCPTMDSMRVQFPTGVEMRRRPFASERSAPRPCIGRPTMISFFVRSCPGTKPSNRFRPQPHVRSAKGPFKFTPYSSSNFVRPGPQGMRLSVGRIEG